MTTKIDEYPSLEELSYESTVPTFLLINKNLEPGAKVLYAIIKGLTRLKGYCYASNAYLAKICEGGESSVTRWIKSLKEHGFLDIETIKVGLISKRRIYISDRFKKVLRTLDFEEGGSSKLRTYSEDKLDSKNIPPTPLKGETSADASLSEEFSLNSSRNLIEDSLLVANSSKSETCSPRIYLMLQRWWVKPEEVTEGEAKLINEACEYFLEKVKKVNPLFDSSTKSWAKPMITLLKKRSLEHLKAVIDTSFADAFWKTKLTGTKEFSKKFPEFEAKHNSPPESTKPTYFSKASQAEENKKAAQKLVDSVNDESQAELCIDHIFFRRSRQAGIIPFTDPLFESKVREQMRFLTPKDPS